MGGRLVEWFGRRVLWMRKSLDMNNLGEVELGVFSAGGFERVEVTRRTKSWKGVPTRVCSSKTSAQVPLRIVRIEGPGVTNREKEGVLLNLYFYSIER